MSTLKVHNDNLLSYTHELLSIDIMGGVDVANLERLVCTLRLAHGEYPMLRSTLDLYNDTQLDKLLHTICGKWELKLLEVSRCLQDLILALENYRIRYGAERLPAPRFAISLEERKAAVKLLKSKDLVKRVIGMLHTTGIIGEDDNALILFLALASHRFYNPFSVLCLAKSGMGKSYILQKLSACLPNETYSFHTQISPNALYYFNSSELENRALIIEDLAWTTEMLQPLSTLQTQGRLIKTRATKDKDGMLHSTTFEVKANLCLLACAYSDKNYENMSLPFLIVHLNHSHQQDLDVMNYQKKCKAGLISEDRVAKVQRELRNIIETLENLQVINPYATLITLPQEIAHPRKSLLLLLNFIEIITYFFQKQRVQKPDGDGVVFLETHPDDIQLAFDLLRDSLFRKADELSSATRAFYDWLLGYLRESKTDQFSALIVRKGRTIHPRTLNRYLQELKLYGYIKIVGGNKHREGYNYKITALGNQKDIQSNIERALAENMKAIRAVHAMETADKVHVKKENKAGSRIPEKPKNTLSA